MAEEGCSYIAVLHFPDEAEDEAGYVIPSTSEVGQYPPA